MVLRTVSLHSNDATVASCSCINYCRVTEPEMFSCPDLFENTYLVITYCTLCIMSRSIYLKKFLLHYQYKITLFLMVKDFSLKADID